MVPPWKNPSPSSLPPSPSILPRESRYVFAEPPKGENQTEPNQNLTARAWFKVSATETGTTCCHSHLRDTGQAASAVEVFPGLRQRSCKGAAGLCHPRGHCGGSREPCAPLFRRKFSRFARSPRQGGCLLPTASSCQPSGKESGRQEIPRPREIPLPEGLPGPGRAASQSGTRPGRPRPAAMRDSGAAPAPADTHSLRFACFSRRERLGRALLFALRPAPAGRSIPSAGALGGGGFPDRVLRPR